MRLSLLMPMLCVLAFAASCARPQAVADAPQAMTSSDASSPASHSTPPARSLPATAAQDVTPRRDHPHPIKSEGLPPQHVEMSGAPKLLTSCGSDNDCAVKNVGSCCGAMPACVNKNSPVDPAAVQTECARKGMASTCGFKDIQSCSCVAGTCRDSGSSSTPVAQ